MQLLDLKTVKDKKVKSDTDQVNRIVKLRSEETETVRSLNEKREFVKLEKEQLDKELTDYKVSTNKEIQSLKLEVESLESRKRDALKPIKELRLEAETKMEEVNSKELKLVEITNKLRERETKVVERIENISDKEQDLIERSSNVSKKEKKVNDQESLNKQSTEKLNGLWLTYHEKVNKTNSDIEKRERKINDKITTAKSLMDTVIKEREIVKEEKRAVVDMYQALEEAKKHLGIK